MSLSIKLINNYGWNKNNVNVDTYFWIAKTSLLNQCSSKWVAKLCSVLFCGSLSTKCWEPLVYNVRILFTVKSWVFISAYPLGWSLPIPPLPLLLQRITVTIVMHSYNEMTSYNKKVTFSILYLTLSDQRLG